MYWILNQPTNWYYFTNTLFPTQFHCISKKITIHSIQNTNNGRCDGFNMNRKILFDPYEKWKELKVFVIGKTRWNEIKIWNFWGSKMGSFPHLLSIVYQIEIFGQFTSLNIYLLHNFFLFPRFIFYSICWTVSCSTLTVGFLSKANQNTFCSARSLICTHKVAKVNKKVERWTQKEKQSNKTNDLQGRMQTSKGDTVVLWKIAILFVCLWL